MKKIHLLIMIAATTIAALAQASPHLRKASPSEGSVLTASPTSIVLYFTEYAQVTAAWIQRGAEKKQPLGPLPIDTAVAVIIHVPKLESGDYVVTWHAVGADAKPISGMLHYKYESAKNTSGSVGP